MDNEKYNGWTNRDTWLVILWIENDYNNYMRKEHKIKGLGSSKKLIDLSENEFITWIKKLHYGDKINWNNVNFQEIKKSLLEDF